MSYLFKRLRNPTDVFIRAQGLTPNEEGFYTDSITVGDIRSLIAKNIEQRRKAKRSINHMSPRRLKKMMKRFDRAPHREDQAVVNANTWPRVTLIPAPLSFAVVRGRRGEYWEMRTIRRYLRGKFLHAHKERQIRSCAQYSRGIVRKLNAAIPYYVAQAKPYCAEFHAGPRALHVSD